MPRDDASARRAQPFLGLVSAEAEVRGWAILAVGALAVAGVFALLLAVSRVPGVEDVFPWPVDFFRKGLVIHVVFSFVVWFLAVFGVLLAMAGPRLADGRPGGRALASLALAGAWAACPLLFVPAFLDRGEATLNDYVPAIVDPLYYAGVAAMAAAMAIACVRYLVLYARADAARGPIARGLAAAAAIYLVALGCGVLALAALAGVPASFDFNQDLFWGAGHVLQVLNTLLVVLAWSVLATVARGGGAPPAALAAATWTLVGAAVLGLAFSVVFPAFSAEQRQAFTDLQYLFAPATLVVAVTLVRGWPRPLPWREPAFLCLALSMLVFGVGGVLGLFVDGADTRTPAHYHGVIAGVTLAFIGLFLAVVLPWLGRPVGGRRVVRVLVWLFALGQLAACIGLFVAGGHGAPRKVAGEAQGLEAIGAIAGMAANGLGGLVAVGGGFLFVLVVGTALLRRAPAGGRRPEVELPL